ncbi:hypothetical protein NIES4103_68660 (plasmid) [Nostoc sp. NIES-4103]|nr:hypothetical protein NIES4103_68660 [Nostoc sp. NIES-4103]
MTIPSRIISGGAIVPCQGNSNSQIIQGGTSSYTARFSSVAYRLISSFTVYGLSKGRCFLIASTIPNLQSLTKIYFNNAFSQDLNNVYLSKSSLGLTGLNLSLEALFVALLIQWANNIGLGSEAKIQAEWLSYGDLDDGYSYFTIGITFRKAVTVVDEYEIQTVYTISPLDF